MKKFEVNHKFAPRDEKEIRQVNAIEIASEILVEKLGLEDFGITIQAQRQAGWAGSDAYHSGMYVNDEKLIKINFRNLYGFSLKQIITVLGHEFRHAVQYQTGLLQGYRNWTGDKVKLNKETNCNRFANYFGQDWEIDARNYQEAYAELVLNDDRFKDFLPYVGEKINDKIMRIDYDASYALLTYPKEEINLFSIRETGKEILYWMASSQIPGCKKWSKKWIKIAFKDYHELMKSQVFEKVMVELTLDDVVS